jgi:hypothetical protein
MKAQSRGKGCFCMMVLLGLAFSAWAQDGPGTSGPDERERLSTDEIAIELSNPASALASLGNAFEIRTYQGDLPEADDQFNTVYLLKPALPFTLANGRHILTRLTIPIYSDLPAWQVPFGHPLWVQDFEYPDFRLRQSPQLTESTGEFISVHGHLGDIGFDVAYGGVSDSGLITMFGIAGQADTSTNDSVSRDQLLLGPEIALGKKTQWGLYGAWLTHLVGVTEGREGYDSNETWIDLFFAYGLGDGWQLVSNPRITWDWEADSGNELLLPLGAGFAKTVRIGKTPVRFACEFQYFVVSPDRFSTEWLVTMGVTPVFPNPFGR